MQKKNSRIAFVNPPTPQNKNFVRELNRCSKKSVMGEVWPQVTLAGVSAFLEKNGFQTMVLDCVAERLDNDNCFRRLSKFVPSLIIFLVSTTTFENDARVAANLKKKLDSKICAIGGHVTALPREALENGFDCVIMGEPEYTILELARGKSLYKIKGLSFKKDGRVFINKKRDRILNLNLLPFPLREKLPNDRYVAPVFDGPYTIITVSRGCPHNCTFCRSKNFYGRFFVTRSVKNVISEIKETVKKYGITNFVFFAETFTLKKWWVLNLCKGIKKAELKITWACNSRVDTFDNELGAAIKSAGCKMITFGIESGDATILKKIKKGITREQAILAVKTAKNNGLLTVGQFILGLPGETIDSLKKTVNFSRKILPDIAVFYYSTPYPGTGLYDQLPKKSKPMTNWSTCDNVGGLCFSKAGVSPKELRMAKRKAYLIFYISKTYVLNLLKKETWQIRAIGKIARSYVLNRLKEKLY